jgi:uncharacterized protein (TIGR02231 family)
MTRKLLAISLSIIGLCLPSMVASETIRPSAPITAVTVFQGQAEITRTMSFLMPAGQHDLILERLPARLLTDSVRLAQAEGSQVEIGAVDLKKHFEIDVVREQERKLKAELRALLDKTREQDDLIKARRLRLEFITALSKEMPKGLSVEKGSDKLIEQDWRQTWTLLTSGAEETLAEIRRAEETKRELDKQIARLKKQLQSLGRGRAEHLTARVSLESAVAAQVTMYFQYQVHGATWRPVYDLRLDTTKETARLLQFALVQQKTGEDWTDIKLTLSTTQPGRGGALPQLHSWFVDIRKPQPPRVSTLAKSDRMRREKATAPSRVMQENEEEARGAPPAVQIVATDFAATYKAPATVSLGSGGDQHRLRLQEQEIATELLVRAVPKLQPFAYLYGEVEYKGEAPLLPGGVALHRDGTYVGRTSLPLLRPGQKLDLSFGIDDRVQVVRRLQTGERSSAGLFNNKKRHERRYLIDVTNHHTREIRISVQDHLPVPRDERIEVELLSETTKPTQVDFKKRKGVLDWRYEYAPGEKRTLRFGFALLHPEEVSVPGF